MEYVQVNYNELQTKQKKLYELVHGPNGLEACGNGIKTQMDILAKEWKDKGHYEHLNAITKEYEALRNYINMVEHYQILIREISTEYKTACSDSKTLASKV